MRLLDLFCCQGGAGKGYADAGFQVVGVDLSPQPRYPFEFHQADAIEFVKEHGHEFDAIHASPPCQAYTLAQRIQGNEHPDLVANMRGALDVLGKPYVIENVPGSPLKNPIELCGSMFDIHTYRHRLFESNIPLTVPEHAEHTAKTVKMGRQLREGDFYHAVGNFSGVPYVRADMGVPWMSRNGVSECIPPVYAEYVGRQLMSVLEINNVKETNE